MSSPPSAPGAHQPLRGLSSRRQPQHHHHHPPATTAAALFEEMSHAVGAGPSAAAAAPTNGNAVTSTAAAAVSSSSSTAHQRLRRLGTSASPPPATTTMMQPQPQQPPQHHHHHSHSAGPLSGCAPGALTSPPSSAVAVGSSNAAGLASPAPAPMARSSPAGASPYFYVRPLGPRSTAAAAAPFPVHRAGLALHHHHHNFPLASAAGAPLAASGGTTTTPHLLSVATPPLPCTSPPPRGSGGAGLPMVVGLGSAAGFGGMGDVDGVKAAAAEHPTPGSVAVASPIPVGPSGLSTSGMQPSGSVAALAGPGSHLSTPPSVRAASSSATLTPAFAPAVPSVYTWHAGSASGGYAGGASSCASAAALTGPWLRLHRPAGGAAVPTTAASSSPTPSLAGFPSGSAGLGSGRKASAMTASLTTTNTSTGAAGAACLGTPQLGAGSAAGSPATAPPRPSTSIFTLEHVATGGGVGAAAEEESPGCSLTGREGGAYACPQLRQQERQREVAAALGLRATSTVPVPLSHVPPFRFARVEAGVYRGAYPVLRNFPYVRRLRLRTIVSLVPEPPTYDLKCFAEAAHIQLHHIHAERAKGEVQLLPSELSEALQLIMNKDMHPLYIHCLDGRHVTGLVIMALRKLLQWDAKAAHAEYLRFTREVQDEVAFIADYTGPLLVPPHLPTWLWGGSLYDSATGLPKKLPTAMRLRMTTVVSGGGGSGGGGGGPAAGSAGVTASLHTAASGASAASATRGAGGGGLGSSDGPLGLGPSPTANRTALSSSSSGAGSGAARVQAAAPWMEVAHAEVVAADGQRYFDLDRLPSTAVVRNGGVGARVGGAAASGSATPAWFSAATGSAAGSTGAGSDSGLGGVAAGRGGTPYNGFTVARGSGHSSHSTSANSSMVGLPPAVVAAAAAAAAAGGVGSGAVGSGVGGALGSRLRSTVSGDAMQQHQQQLASVLVDAGAAYQGGVGVGAGGLLDGRVSTLLWTSGLVTPSFVAANGGAAGANGGAAAAAAGSGGAGRVSGGAGAGGGAGGVVTAMGGPVAGASGGVGGTAAGAAPVPSKRPAKRSYSR